MGINAQQVLSQDPDMLRRQLAMQEMQQLNPQGTAAGAIGALLGRGLGNVTSGRGFFDVADPALKRVSDIQGIMRSVQFDPANPSKYYTEVANALSSQGYNDLAPLAAAEAAKFKGGKISLSATDLEKIDPKDRARVIQTFQSTGKLPEDLSFIDKPKKLEDSLKFFKENPEQATFRLQELSQLIEADPNNKDYIKEFEQISAATSAGAKEKYDREQKNIIDNRLTNLRINKYTQDISDAEKLSPGARWNAEIDAARTLLNGYNIDPSKPLQSQKIPASVLYGPAGASIVDASQKALRKKTTEKEPAPVKPKPETKVPQELESALKAANIPYEPTKYDYRIVNGAVQRKPKGK
jgi:hypothetical protein